MSPRPKRGPDAEGGLSASGLTLGMTSVTKRFGATTAVDAVTLSVSRGEIVGLVGENGAGKTTLMRIAAGELSPDEGRVSRPRRVGMVHQHFSLVPELTIAENLALGDQRRFAFVTPGGIREEASHVIAQSGIELHDVNRRVADLSVAEQAKLELIKAVAVEPDLLILDEPTAVLTPAEAASLFALMRRLADRGAAVVFITHKVAEVIAIARRVVIMRRGAIVADAPASGMTANGIAEAMVGRTMETAPARLRVRGESVLLGLRSLKGRILRDATLMVHRNEIVAVLGVAGNGQSELVELLRGTRRPAGGTIEVSTTRIAFVPEDRTRDGLVAQMTIAENIALGGGRWSPLHAAERARRLIATYGIRAAGPYQRAGALSGGNQQKVILARELDRRPELIIAAEAARGLDVESARFVYDQLASAAASGAGVLLVTSDLDEAFALADSVHVIYRGRLTAALSPAVAAANIGPLLAGLA